MTEHFKLEEFIRSSTAQQLGIDNTPSEEVILNLRNLCEKVLEPLRQWYGKPISISSGYRCPALNRAVGGVTKSQHLKGEAADIRLPSIAIGRKMLEYIVFHLPYDQVIWEHNTDGLYWIHVSLKRDPRKNRLHYIPYLLKA
ncbi:MAG: D-Ala-D-Ala carboxypeptidase family metallohydrolase [Bacteroidaceae bacterium]|nr:DUF882 domain-containing protein [Candidatus Minthousia equi]MCQ2245499.1 D-Ala-D-Ala carboxypeptidase family metallohydrolase [Bacteroidaceae bacterium]MDO4956024.1 D-Ala-D-Ala carboxypeptidase family metallohydrolase [Bacteroidales bacterium]